MRYFYVKRRDARTLIPIIENEVLKGTTIYSDQWGAYNNIGELGYRHIRINHSIEFVRDGAHTNTIEACWGRLKTKILRMKRNVSSTKLPQYLQEEWLRSIMGVKIELLNNILEHLIPLVY